MALPTPWSQIFSLQGNKSKFPSALLRHPLGSTLTAATGKLSTWWVLDLGMAEPCCHGLATLELMAQLSREAVGLLRRADVTLPAEEESQVQTVQCSSVAQSWPTLCDPMDCSTPGFSVHRKLPELAQTHVHSPWCHTTISSSVVPFSSCLQSFPRVFSNESALHIRWPKYWSFSFSISPSNKYSGLISFRMGWFDILAVGGTLKSLLQHHSSKASLLQHSAFFTVQLSHPYVTTGKTTALTRWTFVQTELGLF